MEGPRDSSFLGPRRVFPPDSRLPFYPGTTRNADQFGQMINYFDKPQINPHLSSISSNFDYNNTSNVVTNAREGFRRIELFNAADCRELANAFKEQIMIERDLDNCKEDLISKGDFNMRQAFWEMDANDSGVITIGELLGSVGRIGIQVSRLELDLFVGRLEELGIR